MSVVQSVRRDDYNKPVNDSEYAQRESHRRNTTQECKVKDIEEGEG